MSTLAVATTLIEQPQRQPNQRVIKSTEYLGAIVGHDALAMRMGSTHKAEPRYAKVAKKKSNTSSPLRQRAVLFLPP